MAVVEDEDVMEEDVEDVAEVEAAASEEEEEAVMEAATVAGVVVGEATAGRRLLSFLHTLFGFVWHVAIDDCQV